MTNPYAQVASKCGFAAFNENGPRVTNSAAHIKEYIDGTIERLGFAPDLYYLHRIDPSTFNPSSRKDSADSERYSSRGVYPGSR